MAFVNCNAARCVAVGFWLLIHRKRSPFPYKGRQGILSFRLRYAPGWRVGALFQNDKGALRCGGIYSWFIKNTCFFIKITSAVWGAFFAYFCQKGHPGMRLRAFLPHFWHFFADAVARLWTIATSVSLCYNYYEIIIGIVGLVCFVKNDMEGIKTVIYKTKVRCYNK